MDINISTMKTKHQLPFLILLFLLVSLFTTSFAQTQPALGMSGNELCLLNNGPNDNCEFIDGQILLLDYDVEEGYSLEGLDFPYPVDLANETQIPYIHVYDAPVEGMVIDGGFLELAFPNSAPVVYNMNELEQVGFYFSQGKTAVVIKCQGFEPLMDYLNADHCHSISISVNNANRIQLETGIGTILILDELIDTTLIPPMDDMAKGAQIYLGDPYNQNNLHTMTHDAGVPLLYPSYFNYFKDSNLSCNPQHRALTLQSCGARVSIFSQIKICNNFIIVKDPLQTIPYFFSFSKKAKIYMYIDQQANEIVIWGYGICGTL